MNIEVDVPAFQKVFSAKLQSLALVEKSLEAEFSDSNLIVELGHEIIEAAKEYETVDVGDVYEVYGKLIVVFGRWLQWKHAVRAAEEDSEKFRASAKLLTEEIQKQATNRTQKQLNIAIDTACAVNGIAGVESLRDAILNSSIEISFEAGGSRAAQAKTLEERRAYFSNGEQPSIAIERKNSEIAFLRFELDGQPATDLNFLEPAVAHDLMIEIRVSSWPDTASELHLFPISVDDIVDQSLPEFVFTKPLGSGPYKLQETKRAVLKTAHSFRSRPYEFRYAAEFKPDNGNSRVEIIGHRTLKIEGTNIARNPISGFTNIDRKLIVIRDQLRSFPGLPSADIFSFMQILAALSNQAGQAVRDGNFSAGMLEKAYQTRTVEFLRLIPEIGNDLDEHTECAGGIVDLAYKGICIELKSEKSKLINLDDCKKYLDQTAAYAIGFGKKVALLSILDSSPKTSPVEPVENDIHLLTHTVGNDHVVIGMIIVRGGLAKPSSMSRSRKK